MLYEVQTPSSAGLQLADGRYVINPQQPNRAFDLLRAKFYCEGGREQVCEGDEQWGLKHFP